MRRSDPGVVMIVDRVELPDDHVDGWVRDLREVYLPGARSRGLRLVGIWSTRVDAQVVEVHVVWELPGVGAFWSMRAAALADDSILEWWRRTDDVAIDRDRRVYAPVGS